MIIVLRGIEMKDKLIRFMQGRYGIDDLSVFLFVFSLILMVVNIFVGFYPLHLLSLGVLIYGYFRMFSRNIGKRISENRWFLEKKEHVIHFFPFKNKRLNKGEKYGTVLYKIFSCPQCDQKLRVPKGKGRIEITCRKCGHVFVKRS